MISLELYVQKSFLDKRRCLNVEKFKFLKKKLLSVLFLKFHGSREINIAAPPVFYYMLILIILIFVLFFNLFTGVLGSLFCISVASYANFYLRVSVLFFFPVLVFVVQ